MTEVWIDRATLIACTGWALRTVRHNKRTGEIRWRERDGNIEFAASSLPFEAQQKLYQLQLAAATSKPESTALVASSPAQPALFSPRDSAIEKQRIALSDEQREIAERRYAVVKAYKEFLRRLHTRAPQIIVLEDGRKIDTGKKYRAYLGAQYKVSPRTILRWCADFKRGNLAALANDVRADKGQSRWFSKHPEQAALAQKKYLHERLSIQLAYEALEREFGAENCPSYDTVRVFLNSLPKPITIMAREGERAFNERCAPYLVRAYVDTAPNDYWVSDHCAHDVWVRNDGLFPGLGEDEAFRPWLSAWMDYRSRKIVGAAWYFDPSSYTAGAALRLGIIENGVPLRAYLDNGKDYQKMGRRNELSPETEGVLARLGIEVTSALPYHPQAKPIESWFGNRLHERFDKLFTGFYCGSSPVTRPEDCADNLAKHKAYLAGKRDSSPLPTAREFIELARNFVQEYNFKLAHRGRGMDKRTPAEVFDLLPASDRRTAKDLAALDVLFWDRQRRRVTEGGCIQLYNTRYEPADEHSVAALFQNIGRDILVACDPCNLGEAIAMDEDGHAIGRMRSQKLIAQGPISQEDVKQSMRGRRQLAKATRQYNELVGSGYESELDNRRRRAGIVPMPQRQLAAVNGAAFAPTWPEDEADKFIARHSGAHTPEFTEDFVTRWRAEGD